MLPLRRRKTAPVLKEGSKIMVEIEVRREEAQGAARVALIGDLDDAGGSLTRRELARAVKAGTVNLEIDLDGVGTLSSGGLAALIATLRLARNRGGNVRVVASQPHIRRVMELTGLSRVFRMGTASAARTIAA